MSIDEREKDDQKIVYPEIGYFDMARAMSHLRKQTQTTQGSRMPAVYPPPVFLRFACRRTGLRFALLSFGWPRRRAHACRSDLLLLFFHSTSNRLLHLIYLDMLGDASSNVHMQYLRDGVLMTETEENKLNQTSIRVKTSGIEVLMTKRHDCSSLSRTKRSILFSLRKTLGRKVETTFTIRNKHRWNSHKHWSPIMRWSLNHATEGKCSRHPIDACVCACARDEGRLGRLLLMGRAVYWLCLCVSF